MTHDFRVPRWWHIAGMVLVVVAIWAGLGYLASTRAQPGIFGDMFGAGNALFSGLAFAGVIYAILLQRRELQLQRSELELTRAELEGQKQQLAAQNQTMKKQTFENTFFQLLRLHNDILGSMKAGKNAEGRYCFALLYDGLRSEYEHVSRTQLPNSLAAVNDLYMNFYRTHEVNLGHYFRSLYNIVKFVKTSDVEDKHLYTNLVRAQLSSYELLLLFYNCLSEMGREKFKPLTEEFDLLRHLPNDQLLRGTHASLY